MPVLQRWLDTCRPDVLCVQETKVVDGSFPLEEIRALGYNAVFCGEKSYNGVAILSLHEIEDEGYGFDGQGSEDGARLIYARVKDIHIVNTYIPQGMSVESEKYLYKLRWFEKLRDFFTSNYSPDDPVVWVGDFNVAPENIDVHDPKRLLGHVCFNPEVQGALGIVREWGFSDVFRKYNPGEGHYTFWDYRVRNSVQRGLGWRIDHIYATAPAAERSTRSWIDSGPRLWERPSDHTPILAEFS